MYAICKHQKQFGVINDNHGFFFASIKDTKWSLMKQTYMFVKHQTHLSSQQNQYTRICKHHAHQLSLFLFISKNLQRFSLNVL